MLIRIELYKLRTVRTPWVLLAISQLIVAGGVSGLASSADLGDPESLPGALAHAGLVSILTLVLGIMAVAGEYRNSTITDTYLSTPRRGRVMTAKLAAYGIVAACFGLLNALTALISTAVWWTAKDVPFSISDGVIWRTLAGCVAWNVTFALIGVGLGALIRNLTAAVAVALAWIALVENIVGQLVGDFSRWLPFASGSALGDMSVAGGRPLSQPTAGLVLAGYVALFAVVAVSTTVRRDVT